MLSWAQLMSNSRRASKVAKGHDPLVSFLYNCFPVQDLVAEGVERRSLNEKRNLSRCTWSSRERALKVVVGRERI
jgi:hypothetical protein